MTGNRIQCSSLNLFHFLERKFPMSYMVVNSQWFMIKNYMKHAITIVRVKRAKCFLKILKHLSFQQCSLDMGISDHSGILLSKRYCTNNQQYVSVCVCVRVYMYRCMCRGVYVSLYVQGCICIDVCVGVYMYRCTYMQGCIFMFHIAFVHLLSSFCDN